MYLSYLSPIGIFFPCWGCLHRPCILSTVVTSHQPVVCTKGHEETQSPYRPENPPSQSCGSHPHDSNLRPPSLCPFSSAFSPQVSASSAPHWCPLLSPLPSPCPKENSLALPATPWHAGSCRAKKLQQHRRSTGGAGVILGSLSSSNYQWVCCAFTV